MSWLSSASHSVRKALHLPPITLGNVAKVAAVAGATAVGSPALGAAVAGLTKVVPGGPTTAEKLKTLAGQVISSAHVTVDPLTNTFEVSAGGNIPQGVNDPAQLPARVDLPVYYYVAAAVVLFLLLRGVTK